MELEERQKIATLMKEKSDKSSGVGWMYKGDQPDSEDYLLGKRIDKHVDGEADAAQDNASVLLQERIKVNIAMDTAAKMREDPLFAIRRKEEESRKKLLENPVKMKQLQQLLDQQKKEQEKKMKKQKKSKKRKKKKQKKKSKNKDSDSDSDSDSEDGGGADDIVTKYLSILTSKHDDKSGKERRQKNRRRSVSSDDSENNKNVRKNRQERSGRRGDRGSFSPDNRDRHKATYRRNERKRSRSRSVDRGRNDRLMSESHHKRRTDEVKSRRMRSRSPLRKRSHRSISRSRSRSPTISRSQVKDRRNSTRSPIRGNRKLSRSPIKSYNGRRSISSSEERGKYKDERKTKVGDRTIQRRDRKRYSDPEDGGDDRRHRHGREIEETNRGGRSKKSRTDESCERSQSPRNRYNRAGNKVSSKDQDRKSSGGKGRDHQRSKKNRSSSASSSSSSSQEGDVDKHRKQVESSRQYGLIVSKNAAPVRQRSSSESSSSSTSSMKRRLQATYKNKKQQRKATPPRKKLTEDEKKKRLEEMMDNAKWRDEQREGNVKRYNREDEQERKEREKHGGKGFLSSMMVDHASSSSVEDRLKRNKYNIQRTNVALDRKFTEK